MHLERCDVSVIATRSPAVGSLVMSESISSVFLDAHRARRQGLNAIARRQRARLNEAVALARANSPYYRELYQGLPERIESSSVLPVANKQELMRHFDDWVFCWTLPIGRSHSRFRCA